MSRSYRNRGEAYVKEQDAPWTSSKREHSDEKRSRVRERQWAPEDEADFRDRTWQRFRNRVEAQDVKKMEEVDGDPVPVQPEDVMVPHEEAAEHS